MILYRPSEELLMPGAILFGLGAGYILNCQYTGFTAALPDKKAWLEVCFRFVRFALGITATALLYIGLGKILHKAQDSGWHTLLYFLRFGLVGLWVSAGAPWLFGVMRLAVKKER
jgi:hypothetical protein